MSASTLMVPRSPRASADPLLPPVCVTVPDAGLSVSSWALSLPGCVPSHPARCPQFPRSSPANTFASYFADLMAKSAHGPGWSVPPLEHQQWGPPAPQHEGPAQPSHTRLRPRRSPPSFCPSSKTQKWNLDVFLLRK
ncbi:hypothetical protein J1605_011532 [Eschrichtius robustus]|uniref:Uncharacterized protein n=1 Tax=Eschrichtius robustus TaxID=9764 RepID=A0AB34GNZ9_ESCRO|nr:hypothetical protein J1605_011532 [Eschrichtius robustus]